MSTALTIPTLLKGANIQSLPDTKTHRFRFDIPSESSDKIYRISQRCSGGGDHDGQYECSCPSWIFKRGGDGTGLCKHLKHFKPALDNLVEQAKNLSKPTAKPAKLTAPKTKPSKGIFDDLDDLEVVETLKPTITIDKNSITLNKTAIDKIGELVQLMYSATKGVIVLKPTNTKDNSFDVANGLIEANEFLKTVGKTKKGELELESITLKNNETAFAVSIK